MPSSPSFARPGLRALSCLLACNSIAAYAAPSASALDEIYVTAQRYDQNIQDVPLSVATVSGDEIERDNVIDIGDLTARVPGFAANTGGLPTLYLRGIGSNDRGAGGDPSVGSYQDGIYLGRSSGQIFELLDVERVEIIRGPQGVLFGRNSAGGAINVITHKPENTFSARLSGEYGSFNQQRFTGMANVPVDEHWFFRVAASSLRRDGYVHNAYDNSDLLNADQQALRGTILFEPTTAWQLQLQLSTENKASDGASGRSVNAAYLAGDAYDAYFSDLNNSFEDRDIQFSNFRASYSADSWQFEAITAYRVLHYDDLVDATGTGLYDVRLYAGTDEENRQFNQDFIWHRADERTRVTLGASYYRQRADQLSHFISTSDTVNFAVSRSVGFPVTVLPSGFVHTEDSHNGGIFKTQSAFGDAALTLNEQWELIAGLRYSYDDKHHFVDGLGANDGFAVVFPDSPYTPTHATWSDWSPRAGVNFHANTNTLFYLSWNRGYKSGGFNSFVPNAKFNPEHVEQFELGGKWSGWQQRLRLDAAIFDYRYRDLQVSIIENSNPTIRNAAQAHGRGLDLDLTAQITPAWQLGAMGSWLDAKFTDFTLQQNGAVRDYSGNALTFTPDKQFSTYITHNRSLAGNYFLSSTLRYSFSGRQYFDADNDPLLTENAVNLFDASVSFGPRNQHWQLTAFGKNLSNSEYLLSMGGIARDSLGAVTARRALPRTFGVRAEMRWD